MRPSQATPRPVSANYAPPGDATAPAGRLTVVPSRGGDGLGVSVKVERSGRLFRIEPTRDPHAPRFWCLRVYRCGLTQETVETALPWYGIGGMARADLPAVVAAIRADPTAWLASGAGSALREWMLGDDAPHA